MLDTIKDCAKNSVTWTITSTKGLVQIARGDFKKGLENKILVNGKKHDSRYLNINNAEEVFVEVIFK